MNSSKQKIIPHLWFDDQAEEAASFYTSLFDNSRVGSPTHYSEAGQEIHGQKPGTVMTVEFELNNYKLIGLNAGPHFKFTPALSFFVACETEAEVDALWEQLSEGGVALMELGQYDWSDKYGWVQDRYGLSWQISLGSLEEVGQKITPALTYVSESGKAEEAVNSYTTLFINSDIEGILRYGAGEEQPEGTVMHSLFYLNDEAFMAMDTSSKYADFDFNEAVSLLITCESQEEIDHFWGELSAVPEAAQCGWLKDQFEVSWQVVPAGLLQMLNDPDQKRVEQVTQAVWQMKKLDIQKLKEAYEG